MDNIVNEIEDFKSNIKFLKGINTNNVELKCFNVDRNDTSDNDCRTRAVRFLINKVLWDNTQLKKQVIEETIEFAEELYKKHKADILKHLDCDTII